jgi:hypothetical protein
MLILKKNPQFGIMYIGWSDHWVFMVKQVLMISILLTGTGAIGEELLSRWTIQTGKH